MARKLKPYLFLLPMLLFALGFYYYPAIRTFIYSFSWVNKGKIVGFAGLTHYSDLFQNRVFHIALKNTLKLVAVNTPVTVVITLLLARLCTRKKPGHSVYELLFALPMAVSMSAAALIFKTLLSPVANPVNVSFGITTDWLHNENTAMWGIIFITIWMGMGFNYLLFLSAFRNVPQSITEAAQMDGAGPIRRFFRIELPMIAPTLFYVICTNLVQAIMTSGPVMILTNGGPLQSTTTLIFMMYDSVYGSNNYSLAACISLITFLMTLLFTIGAFALEGRRVRK